MTGLSPMLVLLGLWVSRVAVVTCVESHALDRQSTCGKTFPVYDSDLTLVARSNVAPANPPLECIVYLESGYQASDGRSRLQIIVEQLQIKDCSVFLDFFNGHGASGQYLRKLGCSSSSTDIIYSKERLATLRFTRPLNLYQTEYAITLTVRAYEDGDATDTAVGVDTLSVGAIIGIVVGLLVVIAIAILLAWCCCTGYIHRFLGRGRWKRGEGAGEKKKSGLPHITYTPRAPYSGAESIDSNLEKASTTSSTQQLHAMQWQDRAIWGASANGHEGGGNFRRGVPRKATVRGYNEPADSIQFSRNKRLGAAPADQADPNVYEPYDNDERQENTSPRFRKRSDDPRARARGRGSRSARPGEGEGGGRETTIDDPGSGSGSSGEGAGKGKGDSSDEDAPKTLHREGSEVGVDTIVSPMHINAAVRASVPDLTTQPSEEDLPSPSPRPSKRPRGVGGHGHDPDPMGLPPEAFDPVFTTPSSQENFPHQPLGDWRGPMQPPMAVPFMPYGFVPMVPGQQMYSYAYQSAPGGGGVPGAQGAYFVQSVPTEQGDVRNTAIAVTSQQTPRTRGQGSSGGRRSPHPRHQNSHPPPGAPDYSSSTPREGGKRGSDGGALVPSSSSPPFTSMAVPSPDSPHRSVAVKSFADPDTGMQTTQVLWSDTVPDPSDPAPGESSQVTRKTTTRVTTRSGIGDLPQQTALLDEPDPNPAFLAPSGGSLPPAAITPSADNLHYYTGQRPGSAGQRSTQAPPPRRLMHESGAKNGAIRNTVTLSDSSVV